MVELVREKPVADCLPQLKRPMRFSMIADDDVRQALPKFTDTKYVPSQERTDGKVAIVNALNLPGAAIDGLKERLSSGEFSGAVERGVKKLVDGLPRGGVLILETDNARLSLKHEKRHQLLDMLKALPPEYMAQLDEEIRAGKGYEDAAKVLNALGYKPESYTSEIICFGLEYLELGESARQTAKDIGKAYAFTDRALMMCTEAYLHRPSITLLKLQSQRRR
jgi:hypothetical protein